MQVEGPKTWVFNLAWDQLPHTGDVDARGGREYVRVLKKRHAVGCPMPGILGFIVTEANIGPQDYTGPPVGGEA